MFKEEFHKQLKNLKNLSCVKQEHKARMYERMRQDF